MEQADVDYEILPEVFGEVLEHLPALESDLHHLVKNPTSDDLLASAFRHMHTIKGDFGYCRATPIMEFVHLLEGVMQGLRGRVYQCSALVAEALIQSMDHVQSMMEILIQTHQFDTTPRDTFKQLIMYLAQARDQESADQAARNILLASHDIHFGEPELPDFAPAASTNSIHQALALGQQLSLALAQRHTSWQKRTAFQRALVLALNEQYFRPTHPDILTLAMYWHDVGLLALPDTLLLNPPQPKTEDWARYAEHPEQAAQWLLACAPDCTEAAQIIRQHHSWVDGTGIQSSTYKSSPHQGAQMLSCADLLFDLVGNLKGDDYRRGMLRALFEVNGGLETRFDAQLINAFAAVAQNFKFNKD